MVMQINAVHASLKERDKSESTKLEEEEEDQYDVCKITVIEFVKQTRKKEQLESGKSGEKNHNESKSVEVDKIFVHQLEDSPP
jgi:hypothetical protein